ncbi:MAG: hypothetical protein D6798_16815 [Deltaproteobacteria bacterium]|nr:MAG: hypothetical protein D6798_16815 [Deltaproteobacteria bacterium]
MKRTLPLIITFLVGIFMVGEFFIPHYRYRIWTAEFLEWGLILAAAAFLLGLINLVQVNLPKVIHRDKDWGYKLVMLVSLAATLIIGAFGGQARQDPGATYKWIYDYVFVPLNATMFALLAFYIASAAFRAFRARNLEAGLLLGAAIIVMIARVPAGEALPLVGDRLPQFMNWIMDVPNTAARRAIFIGAALGAVSTGLRVILGLERSHLGTD